MSQRDQGNKQSEKGMAKESGHPKTIKSDEKVGSSGPHGIQFPVHNHPDKSVVRPGGA
jgi:hypothetical protein